MSKRLDMEFSLTKTLAKVVEKINAHEEYKRIFGNFVSLSVLQAAKYLLPLITLPYLVRILGPEKHGLIAFAQAFIGYFNILTEYDDNPRKRAEELFSWNKVPEKYIEIIGQLINKQVD